MKITEEGDAWFRDVEVSNDNELAVQQSHLVEQIGQLIDEGRREFAGRMVQADDNDRYATADDLHRQRLELRVAADVDG